MALHNKHILVGVTGGIAAYKTPDFVRRLKEAGAIVRVVMTEGAKAFITPLTLQAVSGHKVHEHLLDEEAEAGMGHIALARWADLIIIAPASANVMAKLNQGRADDLLTTCCLASKAPVALAPAMNQQMWHNRATQANVAALKAKDFTIWGPEAGSQACGEIGEGRMMEPASLVQHAEAVFHKGCLAGKSVLITMGPTYEPIDPVRYLGNHSSGKMGFAVMQACLEAGAKVTVITGPVSLTFPDGVTCVRVTTAMEMHDAVMGNVKDVDVFIATAAVSDYRTETQAPHKIKKQAASLTLTLTRNPDILKDVSALSKKPFLVGFAAETNNIEQHGAAKYQAKGCDLLVANRVGSNEVGFGVDAIEGILFTPAGAQPFEPMRKAPLARQLIEEISHYCL